MKRQSILPKSNLLTPKEEDQLIEKLNVKPVEKPHRITIDIPRNLYDKVQRKRKEQGFATLSSAIFKALIDYVEDAKIP
jgi:hypothetical protein